MDSQPISRRAATVSDVTPFRLFSAFYNTSAYGRRRGEPGIINFTFGNPHDMPQDAYVETLREAVTPLNKDWFAYKQYEPAAQETAAAGLARLTGIPFAPEDILLTTGGFMAIL